MKFTISLLLVALLTGMATGRAFAQNSFGTILGTVVDQTGAVIPNIPVQVENTATGVISTVTTTSTGDYTAINLVPGPYVVSVERPGFQKMETDVTLVVNQLLRVNMKLQAGNVSQMVKVTAKGAMLDTDTAAISQVVSQRQVASLPLVSRNVYNLVALSPGVVADVNGIIGGDQTPYRSQLSGGSLYIGGNRGSSNGYLIDGVDNNDPGFQTPTITPPIDSVQAFRVMNQNYTAEYGGSAAQVNAETKSGTNAFHGQAYEYLRNDALDAVPDFSVTNPVLRYNQFGAAVGGPIRRNHLFFYGAYEGVRSHTTSTQFGLFPTAAELAGNFAGDPTIYEPGVFDPVTGAPVPFPGNQITTIDPKAQQLISDGMFTTTYSNAIPGVNAIGTVTAPDNIDQYMVRVDAHLNPNNSLFVRFSSSNENRTTPSMVPFNGVTQQQKGKNIAVDYTHIFTPNLINDLHFGLNRPITYQLQDGANKNNIAGIFTGVSTDPATWGAPYLYLNGLTTFGSNANGPLNYFTTDAKLSDVVTWIHGSHTIQAGADIGKIRFKEVNSLLGRGLLEFLGFYTANPLNPFDGSGNVTADFLLGDSYGDEVLQGNYTGWYDSWGEGAFLQDAWKVTPNLTMNLGIRYDYQAPLREEQNRVSTVDFNYPGGRILTPNAAAVAAADSPLVAYTPARDLVDPTKNAWQPRVGLSYRPFANTVIRAGYGIYFDSVEYNEYIFPVLNPPFEQTAAVFGASPFPNPKPNLPIPWVPLDTLFPVSPTTAPIPGAIAALTLSRKGGRLPYVQQWNFNVERQLPGDISLEVGYIGSQVTHAQDRRDPAQGQLMTPGDPLSIVFHYQNFASINLSENEASANYHALIARLEKRYSRGFSFLASYTWSKALGTASALGSLGTENSSGFQDSWNPGADYGPLGYDIRNNFVFSPIYDLPFGRGRSLGANAPAVVNALIGGWQAQGIFTARSGYPFSITATDASGTNGGGVPRASLVPGQDPFKKTPGYAFNINAFQQPAAATFGNSGNNMMRGLGMNNTDFSLIKNTTIHDSLGFQLRVEAFNVFNQAELGPYPGYSIPSPSIFGKYLGVQTGGRVLQAAVQVHF